MLSNYLVEDRNENQKGYSLHHCAWSPPDSPGCVLKALSSLAEDICSWAL